MSIVCVPNVLLFGVINNNSSSDIVYVYMDAFAEFLHRIVCSASMSVKVISIKLPY